MKTKSKIRFILNEPRNPKNIGAAARGMANFGFRDLAVVNPYQVAWRETRSAVNAHEVVTKAKKYRSLKNCLKKFHLVIGTSAASRRASEGRWIGPTELKTMVHEALANQKSVAIVFGSERSGLSNEDLAFCHYRVRIPTVEECPSMNLSQAVAVIAYAIKLETTPPPKSKQNQTGVSNEQLERLVARGHKAYTEAGLVRRWDSAGGEHRLRKALYRWDLNEVDVAMLHSIYSWVLKKTAKS